ncbi:MAG: serpin family protein [Clostridia bacterium]|nr:serpin family protein [Clostridia bacterium]MBQ8767711.1 serpin family protein [Clostridia bacterium]
MKRILSFILTLVLALSVFTACDVPQSDDLMDDIKPNPDVAKNVELVDVSDAAVTDFGVRLFKESLADGENTLISPLSVLVALSMTANGADGETLSQMEAVLGMPIEQLNSWVNTYMSNLPEEEKYKLNLANSIWFKDAESFTVNEDFLQTNADYYGAGIFKAPFDNSTLKEINEWVEDNTDGMIKDILNEIPPEAVMYLVNALAFDAEWQSIYKENQIRDGKFTTEDGEKRDVELMYSSENMYLEDEKATGFIKYYKDRKYAFAALLPNEGISVSDYVASLNGEHLNEVLVNAQQGVVSTAIPKFETEFKVEMSDILKEMGMPDAFNYTAADFSKLGESTEGNICISRVIHQTYINVDGKGTKAGAATVVEMKAESAMEPLEPPKEVYLDRPFVYMLIDCETNLPFFIGTMMDVEG